MKNASFTHKLSFRMAVPVFSAVIIAAVLIAVMASFAFSRFDEERHRERLTRLSQRVYSICENAFQGFERAGRSTDDRRLRIEKTRTLVQLEDMFRNSGLEGLVDDGRETIALRNALSDAFLEDLHRQLPASGSVLEVTRGGSRFYATLITFKPWGWRIMLVSNAGDYTQMISRVVKYYLLGFALVTAMLTAIFIALNAAIKRPIDEIVGPVQGGGVPQYRGIAEFQYLSDQLREAIRKRNVLLMNIEKSHFIYVHDVRGNFTYLSPSVTSILGYGAEDFKNHYTTCFTKHPANVIAVEHTNQSIQGIQQPPYEVEVFHKNGTTRWLEVTEVPVQDEAGKVIAVEGIARDVSDRKLAETELRGNRQLLATLMGSLPGMAYRRRNDGDWTMEFVSEGCRALTGYGSGDLAGNLTVSYGSLIHPEDRGIVRRVMQASIEQGQKYQVTYRIFTATGELKWVWEQGQAIAAGGEVLSLVGFITDITETRRLEEELLKIHKIESLGVLAGGIAHDFNNLLQAILGNVSLARLYVSAPEKLRERLAEVERATRDASELCNRILTFSRGGNPVRRVTAITGPLNDAIKSAASDPKAVIEITGDENPDLVEIDDAQMRQVFQNILAYAREAMPRGGSIRIERRNAVVSDADGLPIRNGNYVVVAIRDEGTGIAADHLGRIFDPYYTTKDIGSARGRGLGLTTCYSIVRRHGGIITVSSRAGKGAIFTVYIPAVKQQADGETAGTEQGFPGQRA